MVSIDIFREIVNCLDMKDETAAAKLEAILGSAWRAFAAYGFRKTSMDDIARGAGMSRPALYLHFRNKEDIFRHLAMHYYDSAAKDVGAALASPGPVRDRIAAAFAVQGGETVAAMLSSPHGMELMDTGLSAAGDIAVAGEALLAGIYAGWLARMAAEGRVRLPAAPEEVAATMTAALKGIKLAGPDYPTYRSRVAQLAALIGTGIEAG